MCKFSCAWVRAPRMRDCFENAKAAMENTHAVVRMHLL